MSSSFDEVAAREIHDYVINTARLGVYDPIQPRRAQVEVAAFTIELLEYDEELSIAHAAGPVTLRTPTGDTEQFLRVSVPVTPEGHLTNGAELRAAYIVETNRENGACKETAALANA